MNLLNDIKQTCKKHGIKFYASKGKYVRISGNIKAGGYFDSENKILAYATKNPNALNLLVHESCHLDQFIEDEKWFKSFDCITIIDEWLDGKEVSKRVLNNAVNKAIELELDCEKRSVEKIKKYGLDIDVKEYIRKANTYLFFYRYLLETRRWSVPERSPYRIEDVYNQSYSRFLTDYSVIPSKLYRKFVEHNI